jgi:ABC-type antimicrobial peptide transport system permease subunit
VLPIRWPAKRIILALLAGLPMVIVGNIASRSAGAVTWADALIALLVGAVYLLVAQYLLARKWLQKMAA